MRSQTWEMHLLTLASTDSDPMHHGISQPDWDHNMLYQAYDHCRTLTALHSKSFYLSSGLLPKEKRQAARALYAFSRTCDDIVDDAPNPDHASTHLEAWRQRVLNPNLVEGDLVALAWADAQRQFRIPRHYAEQLIQGVGQDLTKNRYATFDELAAYAYGVASTVGLMSMHITGFSGREAIPYAIKLGVALQITNILRDVGDDWRNGRLYLPQEELAAFGLTEEEIAAQRVTPAWRRFMDFQIERNRRLYAEAWAGIAMLDPDGRFAIAAAAELYRAILDDIVEHDYNVFGRRAFVTTGEKLRMLPGIWWRSRRV